MRDLIFEIIMTLVGVGFILMSIGWALAAAFIGVLDWLLHQPRQRRRRRWIDLSRWRDRK